MGRLVGRTVRRERCPRPRPVAWSLLVRGSSPLWHTAHELRLLQDVIEQGAGERRVPPRENRQPRREGVREAAQQREHACCAAVLVQRFGWYRDGRRDLGMHTLCLGWKTADRFESRPVFPVSTLLGVPNPRPRSAAAYVLAWRHPIEYIAPPEPSNLVRVGLDPLRLQRRRVEIVLLAARRVLGLGPAWRQARVGRTERWRRRARPRGLAPHLG